MPEPLATIIPTAWSPSPHVWDRPMAASGPLPAELSGDASGLGLDSRPLRRMTADELAEHEREHERTKLREWIASARRSIDPSQRNAEHEAAVAEHIAGLEAELAAVGEG